MRRAIIILTALLIGLVLWDRTRERKQVIKETDVDAATSNAAPAARITGRPQPTLEASQTLSTNSPSADEEEFPWKELSPEQVEAYLRKTKRSPESLINAFLETRNTNFLNEAASAYPDNLIVQWTMMTNATTPEERAQWLEKLKASCPENGLPHYLSALDAFKAGNMEQALADLDAAHGKQASAFEKERIQSKEEMYLLMGYSPVEAKENATESLLLPHLAPMKQLAQEIQAWQEKYLAAGDPTSIQELANVGIEAARQFSDDKTHPVLITQLVGFAMENILLKNLDPGTYYDFLGKTAGERLQEIKDQKQEIKNLMQNWESDYSALNDVEKTIYLNRSSLYGELNAMRWLKNLK